MAFLLAATIVILLRKQGDRTRIVLISGLHREGLFWVRNPSFADTLFDGVAIDTIYNRTALYKPEVTRSDFMLSTNGIMIPVASVTPLCFICEKGESRKVGVS